MKTKILPLNTFLNQFLGLSVIFFFIIQDAFYTVKILDVIPLLTFPAMIVFAVFSWRLNIRMVSILSVFIFISIFSLLLNNTFSIMTLILYLRQIIVIIGLYSVLTVLRPSGKSVLNLLITLFLINFVFTIYQFVKINYSVDAGIGIFSDSNYNGYNSLIFASFLINLKSTKYRILSLILITTAFIGEAKLAILMYMVTIMIVIFFQSRISIPKKIFSLIVILIALFVGVQVLAAVFGNKGTLSINGIMYMAEVPQRPYSNRYRLYFNIMAYKHFWEMPFLTQLFGYGPGGFSSSTSLLLGFKNIFKIAPPGWHTCINSQYIPLVMEVGVLGTINVIIFIFSLMRRNFLFFPVGVYTLLIFFGDAVFEKYSCTSLFVILYYLSRNFPKDMTSSNGRKK